MTKYLDYVNDFLHNSEYEEYRNLAVEIGSHAVKLFSGTAIPIDPINDGQMVLANRSYFERIDRIVGDIRNQIHTDEIHTMLDALRNHELRLKLLEAKSEAIFTIIEDIVESREVRSSIFAKLVGAGADIVGGLVLAVPGVNVAYGAAAVGAGSLVRWYFESKADSILKQNLGYGRALFVDNITCNMLAEKMDSYFKNIDDNESRIEKLEDWLVKKEDEIYFSETSSFSKYRTYYGLSFFDVYDVEKKVCVDKYLGIIIPFSHNNQAWTTCLGIDLEARTVCKRDVYENKKEFKLAVAELKHSLVRSNYKLRLCGCAPIMVTSKILEERVNKLDSYFLRSLHCEYAECRRVIYTYLQNGGDFA